MPDGNLGSGGGGHVVAEVEHPPLATPILQCLPPMFDHSLPVHPLFVLHRSCCFFFSVMILALSCTSCVCFSFAALKSW